MKPWYDRSRTKKKNWVLLRITAPRAQKEAAMLLRLGRQLMDAWPFVERDISVSLVPDEEIRAINKEWRDKDHATDVISFSMGINVGLLGDIVISLDTARRQAKEGGWPLEKELRRLLAHGIVHCSGRDHHSARDALRFAWEEKRLLGEEGMVGESYETLFTPRQRALALLPRRKPADAAGGPARKKRVASRPESG